MIDKLFPESTSIDLTKLNQLQLERLSKDDIFICKKSELEVLRPLVFNYEELTVLQTALIQLNLHNDNEDYYVPRILSLLIKLQDNKRENDEQSKL